MYKNKRAPGNTLRLAGLAARVTTVCGSARSRLTGITGKAAQRITRRFFSRTEGFGMNELLGIAAALIIAAFIIIPGLKELARSLVEKLSEWWSGIVDVVFSER